MTDVQTTADGEGRQPEATPAASRPAATRRVVLAGAGALGATCLLAACGTSANSGTGGANPNGSDYRDDPAPAGSGPARAQFGAAQGGDPGAKGGDSTGGTTLVAVADVPEGGGVIRGQYVITQPAKGTFKAFSKICTHQGCPVNQVADGLIMCPCHQSEFSIADGSVKGGPAPRALPETNVKVDGGNVVVA